MPSGRGSLNHLTIDGSDFYVFTDSKTPQYVTRFNVRNAEDQVIGYVGRTSDSRRGARVWDAMLPDGTVVSRFWSQRSEAIKALVKAPR